MRKTAILLAGGTNRLFNQLYHSYPLELGAYDLETRVIISLKKVRMQVYRFLG